MAAMATGANGDTLTLSRVSCNQGENGPVVLWAESKVQAEVYRLEIERRLAPRRVLVETHRFALSPQCAMSRNSLAITVDRPRA